MYSDISFSTTTAHVGVGAPPNRGPINDLLPFYQIQETSQSAASARYFFYSCRTPYYHPYHSQRSRKRILKGLNFATAPPVKDRKLIIYLSRNKSGAGQRTVDNDDQIINSLSELAKERGDELEVFDPRQFGSFREIAAFFWRAKAVVGPHGAGFYNMFWTAPGALFLEIGSARADQNMFFEMSRCIGLEYLYYIASSNGNNYHVDDVNDLTAFLGDWLTRIEQPSDEPVVERTYDWHMK